MNEKPDVTDDAMAEDFASWTKLDPIGESADGPEQHLALCRQGTDSIVGPPIPLYIGPRWVSSVLPTGLQLSRQLQYDNSRVALVELFFDKGRAAEIDGRNEILAMQAFG